MGGLRGYRHQQANNKAQKRHKDKAKAVKLTEEVKFIICVCLPRDWSPEQIAGRFKRMSLICLHHETIYKYILTDKKQGGQLYKHLRHRNKRYRRRYSSSQNHTGIPNRRDIDERPLEANKRARVGDWKADTIIGSQHQGAIVTIDERKTKLRLAAYLKRKGASYVTEAIMLLLNLLKMKFSWS